MNSIIYFMVGIISTTVGALSGLGGGVIIKPVLDAFGHYDLGTIGILSAFTVFAMSIVSLGRSLVKGVKLEGQKTIALAIGSILGGTIGKNLFSIFVNALNNDLFAQRIQSATLCLLMLMVLVLYNMEEKIKSKNSNKSNNLDGSSVKVLLSCLTVGVLLGTVSAFLGIGGGPLNVIVLMYILKMDVKSSAIHSIFIIFFSQGSKILTVLMNEGLSPYNLEVLPFMVIGGISGGFLGSYLSSKLDKKSVKTSFKVCMVLIILINFVNLF